MEKKIRQLFDFQKFSKNERLGQVIEKTLSESDDAAWGELDDEALVMNAAGDLDYKAFFPDDKEPL